MTTWTKRALWATAGLAAIVISCGKSSTSGPSAGGLGSSFQGFNSIPSVSSALTASKSTQMSTQNFSGTPPALITIGAQGGPTTDAVFYNGLLATIAGEAQNQVTLAQAQQFFGNNTTANSPAGQGACMMAEAVGESFGRALQAGMSACMMKNMPGSASGVTITPTLADPKTVFAQQANDRLVKVKINNVPQQMAGSMPDSVWIKVTGSTTAGAGIYTAKLWFCSSTSSVTGLESYTVDTNKGTYSNSHTDSEPDGQGATAVFQETLSASLTTSAGSIVFDTSKGREITAIGGSPNWGLFKGDVVIDATNHITAKRYNKSGSGGGGTSWIDKNFAVALFTSTKGLKDLAFDQGAYIGLSGAADGTGQQNNYNGSTSYYGAGSYYAVDSTIAEATTAAAESLSTDTFYTTNLTAPTPDFSSVSCSGTPDYTITMDMSDTNVQTITSSCQGDDYTGYDLCYSQAVQAAQNKIFACFNQQGGCH